MTSITSVTLADFAKRSNAITTEKVKELKKWNASQPHLPKLDDCDLALFLHTNCYSLEMSMEHIENYFEMRYYLPEFFSNRDPASDEIIKAMGTVAIVPLPLRTKDNLKVFVLRLIETDLNKYNFNAATKLMNMIIDMSVSEDGPNNEYILVLDIKGTTMKHVESLSWMGLKKFYKYMEKGAPICFIGAHYVNSDSTKDERFEEFVKEKIVNSKLLSNNLHYHPNLKSLEKYIERDILPEDMGGKSGSMSKMYQQQMKKLQAHQMFFKMLDQHFKMDISKKSGKMVSKEDLFGTERDFESMETN